MGTPIIGLDRFFLIDINDSTTAAGEKWIQLAMQNGGSLSRAANKVDTTNKQDTGFTSEKVVTKTWSATAEGFDNIHNMALKHLVDKWEKTTVTDVEVHIKLIQENGEEHEGFASLDSFETSFGTTEVVTYSVSFTGRGRLNVR